MRGSDVGGETNPSLAGLSSRELSKFRESLIEDVRQAVRQECSAPRPRRKTSWLSWALGLILGMFVVLTVLLWVKLPHIDVLHETLTHAVHSKEPPISLAAEPVEGAGTELAFEEPTVPPSKQASTQPKTGEVRNYGYYRTGKGTPDDPLAVCPFEGPSFGFIPNCPPEIGCKVYPVLQHALDTCGGLAVCTGVTGWTPAKKGAAAHYTLRTGEAVKKPKNGLTTAEHSFLKQKNSKECRWQPKGYIAHNHDHSSAKDAKLNLAISPPLKYPVWQQPAGTDLDKIGSFQNGQPTIFISIAAYRDPMCHTTIKNALQWAKYPERLVFGVVEQNAVGDEPCTHTRKPCKEDPTQLICKHRDNIRVDSVPAQQARGPTFGRHRADQMYNGEYFALQIDAHMYFVEHWDEECIRQFNASKNEYAVLSTYPSEAKRKPNVIHGHSQLKTTPGICKARFLEDGLVRHGGAVEFKVDPKMVGHGDEPVLHPWWAAGLSFSRGHKVVRVPNDCCTPMTFNGEEFSMAWRQWTHGYDHYTFRRTVVLHLYYRKKQPHLFWENTQTFPFMKEQSARRLHELFGMTPMDKDIKFNNKDMQKYGPGKRRPLSKLFKVFGVDLGHRTVKDHCFGVIRGTLHRALVKYLRKDGKGIDYDLVPDDVGKQWK
eukprot:TRINITY_DN2456_c0_g1_i9.p1 TRINITY_DN2456_c0_g1~~TRINITY_DN2456_c0_g1_i9.p1  ORF type:complete len:656 (-),score=148.10 TRINITY_DN2456_c0_g1_i9:330-2297(-)